MMDPKLPSIKLQQMLRETSRRGSTLHAQFLKSRHASLNGMRALLDAQINSTLAGAPDTAVRPALFDSRQLDEFGVGQISKCLGPAFAGYDALRIPRIPNGDLKMMSRIVAISGVPRDFSRPASVTAEYDVPLDAWYLRDFAYPEIPTSLYMEIALQPCGFLSAYLDTYSFVPYQAYYFRNLDGSMAFANYMDVRGKTLVTSARLVTSVVSGGSVIQKYAYDISCEGVPVCSGESTFGYFSEESMANQVGLDGGRAVKPEPGQGQPVALDLIQLQAARPDQPYFHLSRGRLHFLDGAQMIVDGGKYGRGYVYANREIDPADWFFPYHFYQDPVMPGSLGIEAMLEALQAYALANGLGRGFRSPRFQLFAAPTPITWRYRGQITQQHRRMELEVHIRQVERTPANSLLITADASLWIDGLRIYALNNAAIGITEA